MLKKEGKGSRCKASEILADGEIEQFCDTGALGCNCPDVLQNTTWFLLCVSYGYGRL